MNKSEIINKCYGSFVMFDNLKWYQRWFKTRIYREVVKDMKMYYTILASLDALDMTHEQKRLYYSCMNYGFKFKEYFR